MLREGKSFTYKQISLNHFKSLVQKNQIVFDIKIIHIIYGREVLRAILPHRTGPGSCLLEIFHPDSLNGI